MKKIVIILGLISSVTYAAAPIPSPNEQQQSWANGVSAANSMNNNGVGDVGLNKNSDVTSGLNSLSTQLGTGTVNIAKQAVDGNGQASSSIQGQYNGAKNDPNYLYNQGQAGLVQCKSQSDPACAAVTRYNDDSVRAALHQYNMGTNSFAYNMYVTPDPSNTTCSIIHNYQPINGQTYQCISGLNARQGCTTTVTPYSTYNPPSPPDGTVVATNSVSVNACGGAWASATASITVNENLTKQNMVILNVDSNSSGHCGGSAPATYNNSIPMSGINQQIYRVNDTGCGGGHWDMGGAVSVSGSCTGTFCNYIVSVNASHGGGDGQCHDSQTRQFNLSFSIPKASWYDNGFKINDQCTPFK